MNANGINEVLAQIRILAKEATDNDSKPAENSDFAMLLKDQIDRVNQTQLKAKQLAEAFERGDPQVNVAEVMVNMQKASLSFQALKQVRNHLLSAYKDIMNMPV